MPVSKTALFAALIVGISSNSTVGSAQNPWMVDRQIASELRESGIRQETDRAIVWFESGVLSDAQMEEFSKQVNQGILDIESYLKIPAQRENMIRYYVTSQVTISHALAHSVFLPMHRVANHTAPYLHETTHIIAPCRDCPMWFSEGLASFVQSYISEHMGGYDGVIFARNGNRGIDRDTARWLGGDRGQAVLPFIGKHEEPPEIAYDRSNVAAPYYVMSQSLVKYMVETAGIECLATVCPASDFDSTLANATGKSCDEWKEQWLAAIAPKTK